MPKAKPKLPVDTKLDYTIVDGVPTIIIAARLTTLAQVDELSGQLNQLALVLPETKARKARAKSKNGRTTRQPATPTEEKTV